jgi:glutaminyl-tRNA synthetase
MLLAYLRFDDTNPATEDIRCVEAIKNDIKWLRFEWDEELHASDSFDQLYAYVVLLVEKGKAYVDSQSDEAIRANRGTVTTPGTASPNRNQSVAENLGLLARMKAGEFPDGAHALRARIDMAHPSMVMRDPLLLRIRRDDGNAAQADDCYACAPVSQEPTDVG